VRYQFGHGLTYTTFETRAIRVTLTGEASATVSVEVTNTGNRTGKHVVQVYVSTDAGPVRRPLRELRGFTKVLIAPGETRTVEIDLPRRSFAYWDITVGDWVVAKGDYRIEVCADAATVLQCSTITLDGDRIAAELTLETAVAAWFENPEVGPRVMDTLGLQVAPVTKEQMAMIASMTMRQFISISGLEISSEALEELMATSRST